MYNRKRIKLVSFHFLNHFLFPQRESNQGQQEPETTDQPLGHGFSEKNEDFSYNIIVNRFQYGIAIYQYNIKIMAII